MEGRPGYTDNTSVYGHVKFIQVRYCLCYVRAKSCLANATLPQYRTLHQNLYFPVVLEMKRKSNQRFYERFSQFITDGRRIIELKELPGLGKVSISCLIISIRVQIIQA